VRSSKMRSLAAVLALILGIPLAFDAAAEEQVAEIIAAQVRDQGHPCDKAESAKRDTKAHAPEAEAVWILTCSNAAYRVRLVPDMSAHIERLE